MINWKLLSNPTLGKNSPGISNISHQQVLAINEDCCYCCWATRSQIGGIVQNSCIRAKVSLSNSFSGVCPKWSLPTHVSNPQHIMYTWEPIFLCSLPCQWSKNVFLTVDIPDSYQNVRQAQPHTTPSNAGLIPITTSLWQAPCNDESSTTRICDATTSERNSYHSFIPHSECCQTDFALDSQPHCAQDDHHTLQRVPLHGLGLS